MQQKPGSDMNGCALGAIVEFAQALTPDIVQIAQVSTIQFVVQHMFMYGVCDQDTSGSHVLRACVCAMTGLPVVADKKGRNSKHNHSVEHTVPLDELLDERQLLIRPDRFSFEPADAVSGMCLARSCVCAVFKYALGTECVSTMVNALLSSPLRQLQVLAMDMNGCAFVSLLLRILHSSTIPVRLVVLKSLGCAKVDGFVDTGF